MEPRWIQAPPPPPRSRPVRNPLVSAGAGGPVKRPHDRGRKRSILGLVGVIVAVAVVMGWCSRATVAPPPERPAASATATGSPTQARTPAPSAVTPGRVPDGYTYPTGYAVVNSGGLPFWDEFQRLGGVDRVGHPLSDRFMWHGFTLQVFQKLVFQAASVDGRIGLLNVMDLLSDAGKDELLLGQYDTPRPLPASFEAGLESGEIRTKRLSLLDADPVLRAAYFAVDDPEHLYGLPASEVTDLNLYVVAIRCQRTVLQRWKQDMPWAAAGEVTAANAGEMAVQLGLFS